MLLRLFILCGCISWIVSGTAQTSGGGGFNLPQKWAPQIFVTDVYGQPFRSAYPDVQGSPFWVDRFHLAKVQLFNGRQLDSLSIKINLLSLQVHFINAEGKEVVAAPGKIVDIRFLDTSASNTGNQIHFRLGLPGAESLNLSGVFQVMVEGKCTILRNLQKQIKEEKNELSGEVNKLFEQYERDCILYDGQLMLLKREKAFFMPIFAEKGKVVDDFVQMKKLSFKNRADIEQIMLFFNEIAH